MTKYMPPTIRNAHSGGITSANANPAAIDMNTRATVSRMVSIAASAIAAIMRVSFSATLRRVSSISRVA